jgi:hypothetical protein
MKSIRELRTVLTFHPQEINSTVKYFAEKCKIDFDVYLPSKRMNLQRDFVWNLRQKRELIWSVLMNRNIPRMAMFHTYDDVYRIIDGKQRLSSMIDFYNGKFDLKIDDKFYFFKDLPQDYQNVISGYHFAYYIVNEDFGITISDQELINWFMFINYAGTIQDTIHLEKFK